MYGEVVDVVLAELQGQQVGVGEVAVVVRLLLGAHRARLALARIEQPRLLVDPAAVFQNADLPARFVFDRLADEADRVDVLDLAARAERLAGAADGHVHVGAKAALLHVAVASAEVAQNRAQLRDIRLRLLGRAQVGPRHDLHERDAGPVEVHEAHRGMQVVDRLAGVLLQMQALDADPDGLALGQIDRHLALADDRAFVLANLVALRQVGIEIVLPVEHALQVDPRLQPQPGADGLSHAFLVDDRQHARHGGVHERDVAVRLAPESGRRARKQLGLARHLGMDLHADDNLPIPERALDELLGVRRGLNGPVHRRSSPPRAGPFRRPPPRSKGPTKARSIPRGVTGRRRRPRQSAPLDRGTNRFDQVSGVARMKPVPGSGVDTEPMAAGGVVMMAVDRSDISYRAGNAVTADAALSDDDAGHSNYI